MTRVPPGAANLPPAEEPLIDYPLVTEEGGAPPPALSARLRDRRTIVSIVVPVVVLLLVAVLVGKIDWGTLVDHIVTANPVLLLLALGIYYLGFPLRGYRWTLLLRGAGIQVRVRDSTEIILISWLVNCVVPAKLGDVYRAYLLRLNFAVSLSKTFGTVFIERIFDLFAIVVLGLLAGYWSFRDGMSEDVRLVFLFGIAVVLLLAVGLLLVRNFGRRLITRSPVPSRMVDLYDRFEEGFFSIGARQLPRLAIITALIWATEALRLYLVILALGFPIGIGISGAFFVALIASLLTAIPFTPAGLGLVELGIVGVLETFYHVEREQAAAIALVDRAISVLSIIVVGAIVYLLSSKTRGGARRPGAAGVVVVGSPTSSLD